MTEEQRDELKRKAMKFCKENNVVLPNLTCDWIVQFVEQYESGVIR